MKSLLVSFFLILSIYSSAQGKYENAMLAALKQSDSTVSQSELLSLSNRFERIAMAEKDKWLPYYYAAMMHVRYVFSLEDKSQADILIDKAEQLAMKADSLSPANSEISCLKSMIASCRLVVDPMNRYMTFGTVSSRELDNAISQDPFNPRPHLLRGQGIRFTPEQFGGGCANAISHLETAYSKFNEFKPQSELHPSWGLNITRDLIKDCK